MADLVFTRNVPVWNKEFKSTVGIVGRDLRKRARIVERAAKRQVHKKSRTLQRAIETDVRPGGIGPIATVGITREPGIGYAYFHHEGTRAHLIAARPPNTHLRFLGRGGAVIYEVAVMHPGTRANRYLSDNLPLAVL